MFDTENDKSAETRQNEIQEENSEFNGNENPISVEEQGGEENTEDVNAENGAEEKKQPAEYAFRWDYTTANEIKKEQKKSEKKGLRLYALVMTIAFLICALSLAALLIIDHYTNDVIVRDRTIFVREYDSESGVLTIPEIAVKVKPSVVGIKVGTVSGGGVGTGIVMTEDGYIATNCHVIEKASSVTVITIDGDEYEAEVIGTDALSDLAVIKVDANDLPAAELGDSDSLVVGELAVAIGTPAGIDYAGTVTSGIISAINRDVKIYDESTGALKKKMTLIQTSANVNPGNSGGPLINEYGQVIGIITLKLADGYDGIGFAIPITTALESLDRIIETGGDINENSTSVAEKRAIIGISGKAVSALEGYSSSGVLVAEVTEGYDAENYLKPGDIIIGIDGNEVLAVSDISSVINSKTAGDEVTLKISRGGKIFDVTVKLGYEQ